MRARLGLTIFVATAVVVAAVLVLAADSTWAVLAGAVAVLLIAAAVVVAAALGSADEGDDRAGPGPPSLWSHGTAGRRRPSTWR
jgi:hypothetical protein